MLSRVNLSSLAGLALVASFVLMAPVAGANHNPSADPMASEAATGKPCKGLKHGVQKSKIWADPATGGAAMSQHGGAVLCGSDFSDKNNLKGFTKGIITMPKGTKIHCMNPQFKDDPTHKAACGGEADMAEKLYVGSVNMGVVGVFSTGALFPLYDVDSKVYIGTAPGVSKNDDCVKQAIACYQGTDALNIAIGNMVIKPKAGSTDKLVLEINPIKATPGTPFDGELTKFFFLRIGSDQPGTKTLNMCKYAADKVGEDKCGTKPENYVQKNGPKGKYVCNVMQFGLKPTPIGIGWIFEATSNLDPNKSTQAYKFSAYVVTSKYQVKNCIPFTLS